MAGAPEPSERADELAAQFALLTGIDVGAMPAGLETPLRSLEVDSLVFVDFIVRTEGQFGFEWDEETPPEAFETLLSMARWMLGEPAGIPAGGEAP